VIEDAAQAHRAEYKGRRIGSIGDIGCFSFYPGKNLGAYGEGGIVVTSNPEYAQMIRMLRDWGQERKYHHVLKGYNYRMDGVQGAILRVKLRYLDAWTEARRTHAALYDQLLVNSGLTTPAVMPYSHHVYHVYAVRSPERDFLQKKLNEQAIQTGIHYPIPVHLQSAYSDLGYKPGDFPHSELAAREVLSLPMYAELSSTQVRTVAETLHSILQGVTV
jgi:dTDP-4-amino-4,6-dideoxygalactose transaminase